MPHGLVVLVALVGLQTANMETGRESQMLYTHVRPIEPYLAALVLEGYERSSTFVSSSTLFKSPTLPCGFGQGSAPAGVFDRVSFR